MKSAWEVLKAYIFPIVSFILGIAAIIGYTFGQVSFVIEQNFWIYVFWVALAGSLIFWLVDLSFDNRTIENHDPHEILKAKIYIDFVDPGDGKIYPQAKYTKTTKMRVFGGAPSVSSLHQVADVCSHEIREKVSEIYADYSVTAASISGGTKTPQNLTNPDISPINSRSVKLVVGATDRVRRNSVIEFIELYTGDRDQYPNAHEWYEITVDSIIKEYIIKINFGKIEPSAITYELRKGSKSSFITQTPLEYETLDSGYIVEHKVKNPKIGDKLRLAWSW